MENSGKIKIIILSAGRGTRMNSNLPKVLVPLGGKPMIRHLLKSITKIYNKKPLSYL